MILPGSPDAPVLTVVVPEGDGHVRGIHFVERRAGVHVEIGTDGAPSASIDIPREDVPALVRFLQRWLPQ